MDCDACNEVPCSIASRMIRQQQLTSQRQCLHSSQQERGIVRVEINLRRFLHHLVPRVISLTRHANPSSRAFANCGVVVQGHVHQCRRALNQFCQSISAFVRYLSSSVNRDWQRAVRAGESE